MTPRLPPHSPRAIGADTARSPRGMNADASPWDRAVGGECGRLMRLTVEEDRGTGGTAQVPGTVPFHERPRTSQQSAEYEIYPCLPKGLAITRPDQVWCADITYTPKRRGFLYLSAVTDRHRQATIRAKTPKSLHRFHRLQSVLFGPNSLTASLKRNKLYLFKKPAHHLMLTSPWLAVGLRKNGTPTAPSAHRSTIKNQTCHHSVFQWWITLPG